MQKGGKKSMAGKDILGEKISQSSIKNENMRAIFGEICAGDGVSRAEISERTGLSLMTVGKVADMLTKEGIIVQAKPATGNAGRRAGMLNVSDSHFILALDLCTAKFRATVMNLRLEDVDSVFYPYNDSLFPEDNLIIFFRETSSLLIKHLTSKKLVGTGICVPGEYDESTDTVITPRFKALDGLKIAETMRKSVGFTPDKIMNGVTASSRSCISALPENKRGCVICLDLDGGVNGSVFTSGKLLTRPSDFASIICKNERTLERNLSDNSLIADEEELCRQIGSALHPIISVLCPDSIFISSGEKKFTEWFPALLSSALSTDACHPEIFIENGKKTRNDMGISEIIRDGMINKL
ncbi:MAG: ROK family transcriptional regulator [Ruminococcaceae bacterium]|nr:ROK family transcriptional regulator [Oscillospiraceae bacterium]